MATSGSFSDFILSSAGKLYLQVRLRKQDKIEQELATKYEGRYRNAGLSLLFDAFMALAVVAFVGIIAAILYFVIN